MVHLATLSSSFEAQLVAARLGAEGVVWQLQGPVGGPLPLSDVSVLVDEKDLVEARRILLLDGLGDIGDRDAVDDSVDQLAERAGRNRGVAIALMAGVVVLAITRTIGMHLI
jgi:hypothetical protein